MCTAKLGTSLEPFQLVSAFESIKSDWIPEELGVVTKLETLRLVSSWTLAQPEFSTELESLKPGWILEDLGVSAFELLKLDSLS